MGCDCSFIIPANNQQGSTGKRPGGNNKQQGYVAALKDDMAKKNAEIDCLKKKIAEMGGPLGQLKDEVAMIAAELEKIQKEEALRVAMSQDDTPAIFKQPKTSRRKFAPQEEHVFVPKSEIPSGRDIHLATLDFANRPFLLKWITWFNLFQCILLILSFLVTSYYIISYVSYLCIAEEGLLETTRVFTNLSVLSLFIIIYYLKFSSDIFYFFWRFKNVKKISLVAIKQKHMKYESEQPAFDYSTPSRLNHGFVCQLAIKWEFCDRLSGKQVFYSYRGEYAKLPLKLSEVPYRRVIGHFFIKDFFSFDSKLKSIFIHEGLLSDALNRKTLIYKSPDTALAVERGLRLLQEDPAYCELYPRLLETGCSVYRDTALAATIIISGDVYSANSVHF